MAGLNCIANVSQTLVADVPNTVLQLKAPTNHRILLTGYSLTIPGLVAKDLLLEILYQTDAGSGGVTTGILFNPVERSAAETPQSTLLTGFTGEPGVDTPIKSVVKRYLQSATDIQYPFGSAIPINGSARIAARLTSIGQAATVVFEFRFEE